MDNATCTGMFDFEVSEGRLTQNKESEGTSPKNAQN
jgi:hypothetical protein